MIYMEKLISDKQHVKHVYSVLQMLKNKMKRLQVKKCKFENSILKNPEIRRFPNFSSGV